jgi:hypothetical protein
MEGWKIWSGTGSGEWTFTKWHYLVPPGWREWTGRRLEEICAHQWVTSVGTALNDLRDWCHDRVLRLRHEDALADPSGTYARILKFCDLPDSDYFQRQFAEIQSRAYTHRGSAPAEDKWRRLHLEEIEAVRPMFAKLRAELFGN